MYNKINVLQLAKIHLYKAEVEKKEALAAYLREAIVDMYDNYDGAVREGHGQMYIAVAFHKAYEPIPPWIDPCWVEFAQVQWRPLREGYDEPSLPCDRCKCHPCNGFLYDDEHNVAACKNAAAALARPQDTWSYV